MAKKTKKANGTKTKVAKAAKRPLKATKATKARAAEKSAAPSRRLKRGAVANKIVAFLKANGESASGDIIRGLGKIKYPSAAYRVLTTLAERGQIVAGGERGKRTYRLAETRAQPQAQALVQPSSPSSAQAPPPQNGVAISKRLIRDIQALSLTDARTVRDLIEARVWYETMVTGLTE